MVMKKTAILAMALLLCFSASALLAANVADKVKESTEKAAKDYMQHGLIQAAEGRHESAVKSFQKAIGLMPNLAEAYSLMGSSLSELGRYKDAEEALRKAVAIKPNYGEGYYYLGLFLKERGRAGEAEDAFRKAKQYGK
jgi:Tfp pilus assembly protein PilF